MLYKFLRMSDQVEQREEKDPHDVDEVPIKTRHFDRGVIGRAKGSLARHQENRGHNAEANHHVEGVEAGHEKVKAEQDLRLVSELRWSERSIPGPMAGEQ